MEEEEMNNGLRDLIAAIDGRAMVTHLVLTSLVSRMALASGKPREYADGMFEGISAILDEYDLRPGSYEQLAQLKMRDYLAEFFAAVARNTGQSPESE
jgi:hypothetical protein